jgi:hypothetical protein
MEENKSDKFKELILSFSKQVAGDDETIYFKPDIPEKKLKKAISSYAEGVIESQVIALAEAIHLLKDKYLSIYRMQDQV